MGDVNPEAVRRHLEKLCGSAQLGRSETSRKLATYLVERSIRNDPPKETEIALDVFGKNASFNGAEDSVVRVGVRTLRQKLAEYYAGTGRDDELHFVIPKGGYRLDVVARAETPASRHPVPDGGGRHRAWAWTAGVALALLAGSLVANLYLWHRYRPVTDDPSVASVRSSAVWADMVASRRPVTIVLGDLFMYTQSDPETGRTLTVRDTGINSSEELRAFLASHPAFAAERGKRYVTMIQKSAALGMASILRIVDGPGRRVTVTVRDELQADEIRNNDIIYLGPMVRLGPLAGYYQLGSRYRYNAATASLTDTVTRKVFLPQGTLGSQHTDYALAAKFSGPTGNHILIFTSGARNAGLLQILRTLTSPEGLTRFEARSRTQSGAVPRSFEALLTVTGYKQTDLVTEFIDINALPASRSRQPVVRSNTLANQ